MSDEGWGGVRRDVCGQCKMDRTWGEEGTLWSPGKEGETRLKRAYQG